MTNFQGLRRCNGFQLGLRIWGGDPQSGVRFLVLVELGFWRMSLVNHRSAAAKEK